MNVLMELADSYRVEVSGWDALGNFFVEKTMLEWSREMEKTVRLRQSLTDGSILFVRLLQRLAKENAFPIAYRVINADAQEGDQRTRLTLTQLKPNVQFKEIAAENKNPATQVA